MRKRLPIKRREFIQIMGVTLGSAFMYGIPGGIAAARETTHISLQPPNISIGMLGHLNQGKTTLTSALTRMLSLTNNTNFAPYATLDNPGPEIVDGVPIQSAQVEIQTRTRSYQLFDCHAHDDFVRKLLLGSGAIHGSVLVVASDDGLMPQAREAIFLAEEARLPISAVFINKNDLLDDPELIGLIELEIIETLESYGYNPDVIPLIRGSALDALTSTSSDPNAPEYQPLNELLTSLDVGVTVPDVTELPFFMPIQDIFTIQGRGTVVTGNVERGMLTTGEAVEIVGLRDEIMTTEVTGIEMFQSEQEFAQSGDNVGVLLRGISADDVQSGMVLATPRTARAVTRFSGSLLVLSASEGGSNTAIVNGYRPTFLLNGIDITGTIELPEGIDVLLPGDMTTAEVMLVQPMALLEGMRFRIREGGRSRGLGLIVDVLA